MVTKCFFPLFSILRTRSWVDCQSKQSAKCFGQLLCVEYKESNNDELISSAEKVVRPWPDRPLDRRLRPWCVQLNLAPNETKTNKSQCPLNSVQTQDPWRQSGRNGGKDLWKRLVLSLGWKTEGVTDGESKGGDCDAQDEGQWTEWGWRNEDKYISGERVELWQSTILYIFYDGPMINRVAKLKQTTLKITKAKQTRYEQLFSEATWRLLILNSVSTEIA